MSLRQRRFHRYNKYLSLKKYCDKRHIPFALQLGEYSNLIEKACYSCKEKRYLNNLIPRELLKGYIYNNVNVICDNCLQYVKH